MRCLYMKQINIFDCQYRAASHAKQAVLIPKPDYFMLATQCPGLCWTLEAFFCYFKIQLLRDVHPSTQNCRALNSKRVLSGDWSPVSFESAFTSQVFNCHQFSVFFLDGWDTSVPHPLTHISHSCQAFLNLFTDDCLCFVWMRWFNLQPCP